MNETDFNALHDWALHNLGNGCTPESLMRSLLESGYSESVAIQVIHRALPTSGPTIEDAERRTFIDLPDRRVHIATVLSDPCVIVIRDFLSEEECAGLIDLARARLARSTTVSTETGEAELHHARTSDGGFFQRGEAPLIARVEKRIAQLLNWPVEHGEGLQVLRYGIGGEYRPHFDYFDPALPGSATHLTRGGQRLGTFLMYLNTPDEGGHTAFPRIGMNVAPIAGQAAFFISSTAGLIDPRSEHASIPITKGEKWVATKWLRQQPFV